MIFSCGKKSNTPSLPPITSNGANSFGMLVNGNVWLPVVRSPFAIGQPPLVFTLKQKSSIHFEITGAAIGQDNSFGESQFQFSFDVNYPNLNLKFNRFYVASYLDTCITGTRLIMPYVNIYDCKGYRIIDTAESNVTLIRFDTLKKIISGTFNLNLQNYLGQKISITQGRFDYKIY